MCQDANKEPTHHEIQQLCWNWLISQKYTPKLEARMPSRRVADIYLETPHGAVIVECKTIITPSIVDEVWKKYAPHCNYLFIAGPDYMIRRAAAEKRGLEWRGIAEDMGYISIKNFEVHQISDAVWHLASSPCANGGPSRGLILSPAGGTPETKNPEP